MADSGDIKELSIALFVSQTSSIFKIGVGCLLESPGPRGGWLVYLVGDGKTKYKNIPTVQGPPVGVLPALEIGR